MPLRVNSPCRRQSRNKLKGLRPLNNPEVFGQSKSRHLTALRVSKKWLSATFLSFTGFASRKKHAVPPPGNWPELTRCGVPQGSKTRRVRKPSAFICSDPHPPGGLLLPQRGNSPCVVRAELSHTGLQPHRHRKRACGLYTSGGKVRRGQQVMGCPPSAEAIVRFLMDCGR